MCSFSPTKVPSMSNTIPSLWDCGDDMMDVADVGIDGDSILVLCEFVADPAQTCTPKMGVEVITTTK